MLSRTFVDLVFGLAVGLYVPLMLSYVISSIVKNRGMQLAWDILFRTLVVAFGLFVLIYVFAIVSKHFGPTSNWVAYGLFVGLLVGFVVALVMAFKGVQGRNDVISQRADPDTKDTIPFREYDGPMAHSPVSFTVRLTPSDLYHLQLWVVLRGSRYIWILPVLLALLTVNTFRWNIQEQEALTTNFDPLLKLIGFYIVLFLVFPFFFLRYRFKNDKSLQEETRYTVSEGRIDMESTTASSRLDWSRIVRAVETEVYFYLFTTMMTPTFIIPKRDISVETRITDLREILRNCVKGKVRLLS